MIKRHKPSQRPALTRNYHRYCVRNLNTMKVFHVYSENHIAQMIANGQISDETHDVCIAVSADFGYSGSRKSKDGNLVDADKTLEELI